MRRVLLYGDSIGRGVVYNEERGRYCLAGRRCTKQLISRGIPVEDYSRMGATILDGFQELQESDLREGDLAVIEFGGNDCDMDWEAVARNPGAEHDARVTLTEFRKALQRFIREVRGAGAEPVAVIPPPLMSDRYFRWVSRGRDAEAILTYLGDENCIYRWQELYADAVRDIAESERCTTLDVRRLLLKRRDLARLMCLDGIHPNDDGHAYLSDCILQAHGAALAC